MLHADDPNYVPIYPIDGVIFFAIVFLIGYAMAGGFLYWRRHSRLPVFTFFGAALLLLVYSVIWALFSFIHPPNYVVSIILGTVFSSLALIVMGILCQVHDKFFAD